MFIFIRKILTLFAMAIVLVSCANTGNVLPEEGKTAHKPSLDIQSWQTQHGARVMYVYAPQLPMVDIQLTFDAGSARDKRLPGLAMMTNAMLDLGAGEWDTNQIAERFDSVGAQFSNSSARDMAILSLRSLTEPALLEKSIVTLQAILTRPNFVKSEIQRIRNQIMVGLRNQKQSPAAIAQIDFYKALYGQHPYASPVMGTEKSVEKIRRSDLLEFYKTYYVTRNAVLAIVGDVKRSQAEQLAEQILQGLPEGKAAMEIPSPGKLAKPVRIQRDFPSTQTHILVGQPGMKRDDSDYMALYVGNHILGGSGFGSRIMDEIREKRGLAYSSYSYFSPMRVEGPFVMGLQTGNANAKQALVILDKILRNFIEKGPSKAELQHAKKNITGGFALRIDSNKDILAYLGMIGFYNLPLDYLQTFNQRVEKVSMKQIQEAFRRRIDPDRLVTVTVGSTSTK